MKIKCEECATDLGELLTPSDWLVPVCRPCFDRMKKYAVDGLAAECAAVAPVDAD